ncbi:S8 family serine peptidase [Streptomyces sp. ACA25]|uniref:S8 family serine peptidase n=1 Tax=Streptomyces sp. ACA25 TaxID=3022596 RepID=UPI0023073545|nr:S8 family serine peptidase [Streptomyces sp. ACA25]MDB1087031.1 S8 family serine peptidase [Streptomyces sp. ACA25]
MALSVTLTAGLAAASAAPQGGPPAHTAEPVAADGESRLVTLITGDRVAVDSAGRATGLLPAEGREHIPVKVFTGEESTLVLPLDAFGPVRDGSVDRRLFDVTELSREQYDGIDGVPVIVTYGEEAGPEARNTLHQAAEPEVRAELETINGQALTLAPGVAPAAWAALTEQAGEQTLVTTPGIAGVSLDAVHQASLDGSAGQIGAPDAWEAGFDGTGVTVAVLDTGIDDTHQDLAGQVVAAENFTDSPDTHDRQGHGTHVASTAAGTGALSGGKYRGVAPGAQLLNAKVLDDEGSGFESGIIEGMEWAVEQGAQVINMSLGGSTGSAIEPMEEAVNRLSEESGALFVIAAGNSGPGAGSLGTPGTADAALTLGAVSRSDVLAGFSSVGPRTRDGALKPDATAPGVGIAAAAAEGSVIGENGEAVADGYVAISGTSMAAPHAAGAAALLAQQHPDWSGDRIKAALLASARGADGHTAYQQGSGRIDLTRAVRQTVITEPASLSFGTVAHPHDAAEPVTRELTYRNLGDSDLALDLEMTVLAPDGTPGPEDMFTLDADRVTLPARSTATVRATAHTRHGGDVHGGYSMFLTATGEEHTVRTAGAVDREPEMFHLTLDATDRSGAPATEGWEAVVIDPQTFTSHFLSPSASGSATVRLPEGDYLVEATVLGAADEESEIPVADWMLHPQVRLTEDTSVSFAAAGARPMVMSVPDDDVRQASLTAGYTLTGEEFHLSSAFVSAAPGAEGFGTAQTGPAPQGWQLSAGAGGSWVSPEGEREYHGHHIQEDGFYTGLTDHIDASELARITTGQGASAPGKRGALFTSSPAVLIATATRQQLPWTTEVYVRAEGTRWSQELWQLGADDWWDEASYRTPARAHSAGEHHSLMLNTGVYGPLFEGGGGLVRAGDTLKGWLTPFADGSGHRGGSVYDSAETVLYRNGEVHATSAEVLDFVEFEVPEDAADYRLETTISRAGSGTATVTSEVTASYSFRSESVTGTEPLPAAAVRYAPELDLASTSPALTRVDIPVTVEQPATEDEPAELRVEVSYDSGASWQPAELTDGLLVVDNPAAGGSVSLRAEVEDSLGNLTVQTIIDAYRTR